MGKSGGEEAQETAWIEQRVTHPIPVISNLYNVLCNDMNGRKAPKNAIRLRDLNSKHLIEIRWRIIKGEYWKINRIKP